MNLLGKIMSNVVLNILELLFETLDFWGDTTTWTVADVQLFPNYGNNTFLSYAFLGIERVYTWERAHLLIIVPSPGIMCWRHGAPIALENLWAPSCRNKEKLSPLNTMVKDHDQENVGPRSPQTTSKGCPMEIEKSFMCEPKLWSMM